MHCNYYWILTCMLTVDKECNEPYLHIFFADENKISPKTGSHPVQLQASICITKLINSKYYQCNKFKSFLFFIRTIFIILNSVNHGSGCYSRIFDQASKQWQKAVLTATLKNDKQCRKQMHKMRFFSPAFYVC